MESLIKSVLVILLITIAGSFVPSLAVNGGWPTPPVVPPGYGCEKQPEVCHAEWGGKEKCCNNSCVNLNADFYNCGECGHECRKGFQCCTGKCHNLLDNKNNCGKCGNKCVKPNSKCCSGRCVDEKTDKLNCGKCGRVCELNWSCCKGKCVNLEKDEKNCGACKNKCKEGKLCYKKKCIDYA